MVILRVLACLVVFVALIGPSVSVAQNAASPVALPVIVSLTGPAAFIGKEEAVSFRIIERMVNERGGINGRTIHFDVQDEASNPAVGLQLVNGLISAHSHAIFGPMFTPVCLAVAPLLRGSGPLSYCLSPGVHPEPGSMMFSGGVGSQDMALAVARYFSENKWQRIAILSSTDASGQDFEKGFDEALSQHGDLTVVDREHFAVPDVSVAAQIARIEAAKPQVVIVATAGTGFGTALHAIHDAGLNVPIMSGGNGNMIFSQLQQYRDFIPARLLFPGLRAMANEAEAPRAIRTKQTEYREAFAKEGVKPDLPANLAWDSTWLMLSALKAKGFDASAEQLREFIASQRNWIGANGSYDFVTHPQRGIGVEACVIDRYDPRTETFVPESKPGGGLR